MQTPKQANHITVNATDLVSSDRAEVIRVLHVDDDPCILSVSEAVLTVEGNFEIDHALCVDEAFKKLETQTYDVIISDYEMPQKNGIEFLRELKEQKNSVPFILFTGKGREEVAVKALNLGADGYFNKQGSPETVYGELSHGIRYAVARKKAEEALRQSEAKLRSVVENSSDQIFMVDKNFKYLTVNKTLAEVLGKPFEKIIGKSIPEVYPESGPQFIEHVEKVFFSGRKLVIDEKMVAQNKEYINSTSLNPVKADDGNIIAVTGIVRDITERKKAEEALHENQRTLNQVFAASPDAITVTDMNGNITECNEAALKLGGFSAKDELIGKNGLVFIAKKDCERAIANLRKTVEEGVARNSEYTLVTKNGCEYPGENSVSVIKDESGKLTGFVAITKDITKRKKAEEQLKEDHAQLQAVNEKLHVVGSLTRHDVRNTLSVILANTYLLKKQIGDNPLALKNIEAIESAAKQSENLFKFSSLYEKIGVEKQTKIEVATAFQQAATLTPHMGIEVVNKTQGLTVLADTLLRQLLYNLIDNSKKHGKTVTQIQLSYTKSDKETKLLYEDNGVGIPKENKEKIFAEGFTTGGSGLGLKLVKKMIEVYGWAITEEGESGMGAKFVITIPNNIKA